MYNLARKDDPARFAVAPMLDWSDRHCRFFHRQMSSQALLYSEMVVADAIIHGERERLLAFDVTEHPLALQLGGCDADKLKEATRIALDYGYDEVNLNVGCPSDRVRSGTFGACLMREPQLVGRLVEAIKSVSFVPVTVKCRLGVDEQDSVIALDELANAVWNSGADAIWVHARKAWLQGLSPKENRDIPPLDYERVYRLKAENQQHFVGINGGIADLDTALPHLEHCDGVMLGRAAYQNPQLLMAVDARIYGKKDERLISEVMEAMAEYIDRHVAEGGRAHHITRHMVGLFAGQAGARRYRQILSGEAQRQGAGSEVLVEALKSLDLDIRPMAQEASSQPVPSVIA